MENREVDFKKEIEYIKQQLIDKYKPNKIILFGSAAWGKTTPDSDIDFLVIKEDVPHFGIERMRQLDRLINYKIAADFLVYKPSEYIERLSMGDPFIKTINSKGKVLYG